ncbi:MBL fold metallo-hydrolase [Klenkia sp. PcliD-1-E]|uniref:MBL fold metallo-hydrolase n=1 Tax=Klenkia sp. PcliD-1-E TaxID=2954492 RepID=UPI0020980E3D|nr:MBL fold metallo-hydrolase [Klenkia sp. PcliD-1-E]MCO7220913.1 MBL fold metallo-hydrolase [Klenkia sp. PcliD-1-E]
MCDLENTCATHPAGADPADADPPAEGLPASGPRMSRRGVLGALAASAAAVTATGVLGRLPAARADTTPAGSTAPVTLTLLGTAGGPPPQAARSGIASALTVNGRTYVVDCGRGAVSQYMKAGLSMPGLAGIFLTHLHADHTVDYFSFPLLAAGVQGPQGFQAPIDVYGPGPAGMNSQLPDVHGRIPGTVEMTDLQNRAFASSTTFFLAEHFGIDPTTLLRVHDVLPPRGVHASPSNTAPTMTPFTVMENSEVKVTAVLVPHGAVYPAYAYRFDTDHGSVVFSGDTALTPNVPTLARGADVLVHEAAAFSVLQQVGYPQPVIDHIKTVHTDVAQLGAVAAQAGVSQLVASHLSPVNPAILPDSQWNALLQQSAWAAGYGGRMTLGTDLLQIPLG